MIEINKLQLELRKEFNLIDISSEREVQLIKEMNYLANIIIDLYLKNESLYN